MAGYSSSTSFSITSTASPVASEMAIMPGTDLPEEIEDLIFRNWSRPYLKFYYPNFVL